MTATMDAEELNRALTGELKRKIAANSDVEIAGLAIGGA